MDFWGIILGAGIATTTNYWASRRAELTAHRIRKRERQVDALEALAPLVTNAIIAIDVTQPSKEAVIVSMAQLVEIMKYMRAMQDWAVQHSAHLPDYIDISRMQHSGTAIADMIERFQSEHGITSDSRYVDAAIYHGARNDLLEFMKILRAEVRRPIEDLVPRLIPDPESYVATPVNRLEG